jgi:hypothetical protein
MFLFFLVCSKLHLCIGMRVLNFKYWTAPDAGLWIRHSRFAIPNSRDAVFRIPLCALCGIRSQEIGGMVAAVGIDQELGAMFHF